MYGVVMLGASLAWAGWSGWTDSGVGVFGAVCLGLVGVMACWVEWEAREDDR